jgi:protease-4
MRQAFEDEGSQAVVLLINSPGGSPVQAGMINDEIKRLKALHQKPVYAVVEETCASAAYYIAAGADKIFVDKASIVGSIGVLMDGFGFTGLMDKVGVERRLMTAGENKGFVDPFSTPTKQQKAHAQHMLDQIHQQFIAVVREGRGDRLKDAPEIFSGLFWSGQQAIELGLADGYGTLDSVARDVVKAEDIVDYTRQDNVAERLAKRFGAAMGEAMVKSSLHLLPHIRGGFHGPKRLCCTLQNQGPNANTTGLCLSGTSPFFFQSATRRLCTCISARLRLLHKHKRVLSCKPLSKAVNKASLR